MFICSLISIYIFSLGEIIFLKKNFTFSVESCFLNWHIKSLEAIPLLSSFQQGKELNKLEINDFSLIHQIIDVTEQPIYSKYGKMGKAQILYGD